MTSGMLKQARDDCLNAFSFLTSDFRCQSRARFLSRSGFELYYWNSTTGVQVVFQLRDPFSVYICRVPNGKFPPRVGEFAGRRRISWVNLESIVKKSTKQMPSIDEYALYGMPSPEIAECYAEMLRIYCGPILNGDFCQLDGLE